MAASKIVFYHPLIWNHLKRIAKNNTNVDPNIAEKINSFLTFSKESAKHKLLPDVFSEKFVPATPEYTFNFSPNIVKQFIEGYTKLFETAQY